MDDVESKAFRFFRAIAVSFDVLRCVTGELTGLQLVVDVVRRQSSFISEPEWKTVPWSRSYPSKDLVDLIEDIAVDVPFLLTECDSVQALPLDDIANAERHALLLQQVQSVLHTLSQYRDTWLFTHPTVQAEFKKSTIVDGSTLDNILTRVSQSDPLLAQALTRYYAIHLVLLRVQSSMSASPWLDPTFITATICTIIEMQLAVDAIDYTVALGFVFPLHVAFEASAATTDAQGRMFEIWRRMRTDHGIVFAGQELDRNASALETRLAIDGAGSYG